MVYVCSVCCDGWWSGGLLRDGWAPCGTAPAKVVCNCGGWVVDLGVARTTNWCWQDVLFLLSHGRVPLMSSMAMSTSVATSLSVSGKSRDRIRGPYARLGL